MSKRLPRNEIESFNTDIWIKEVDFAITICDKDGIILEMNDKSCKTFAKNGGSKLIGESIFSCHPPVAQEKIKKILDTHNPNVYTIEKEGQKKLIYQTPWYDHGELRGLVELSLVIPTEMPHYRRNS